MLDSGVSERIKEAIKEAGGYKVISESTGLNTRTLTRITSGETDPKLSNFLSISEATGVSINYLAYGVINGKEEELSAEIQKFQEVMATFEENAKEMAALRKIIMNQMDDPSFAKALEGIEIANGQIRLKNS
ncbi:helix-turn-helix transcriptional regulator [Vibrio vulnificus]